MGTQVKVDRPERFLTDNEKELRDWLRGQPGGDRWWLIVKAGFRASYKVGLQEAVQALDELPGTAATGYYASGDHAGYTEAVADMERLLTARVES